MLSQYRRNKYLIKSNYIDINDGKPENVDQYLSDIALNEEDHQIYVSKRYRGFEIYR